MSIPRRIAWNTGSQSGARVATLALGVLTTVLLTRHLGVAGYGTYVAVTVYTLFFAVISDTGITTLLARELVGDEPDVELFRLALGLRLAVAVVAIAIAYGLAYLLYDGGDSAPIRRGITIALPLILFNAAAATPTAYFQAQLRMGWVAAAEVTGGLVSLVGIVAVIATGRGVNAVIAAVVVGAGVNAAVLLYRSRGFARPLPIVDAAAWRPLLRTALPLGLAVVIATIYFRADAILLSLFKGPHAVGIYGVAYRLLEAVIAFPGFFVISVFPLFSTAAKRGDLPSLRTGAQRAFDILVLVATLVTAATIVFAPQIIHVVGGPKFAAAVTPLRVLIVGAGLMFLNLLFAYMLIAVGAQKKVVWISAAVLAFNVALNVVLIPRYSYNAAAAVATASEILSLVAFAEVVRRTIHFLPRLRIAAQAVAAALVGGAAALLVPGGIVVAVLVSAAVYASVLFVLGTHKALELRQLLGATN